MNQKVNYTPGPSQLYFTVEDHMRAAFREGIPSLSHRAKKFEEIFKECTEGLRQLLDLPATHHIYFTGSATEIWERIIQNLVAEKSFHLVNGSFSKRFYEIAVQLNRKPEKSEVPFGKGFDAGVNISGDPELIAVTHNETSTGVCTSPETIHSFKTRFPKALLAVDAVSSLPYPEFDYNLVDTAFFSVQKSFGLPAGLGVWIANEKCLGKSEQLLASGVSIGSYHTLPGLHSFAVKNQTPETPNVLGIYLLSKVIQDMLRRGIQTIRRETEYKAALLYQALDHHRVLKPFVTDKAIQSRTVIVADCGESTADLTRVLQDNGIQPGDGYGTLKKTQLRFANFPTHSKEQYEQLVDVLSAYSK